MPAVTQELCEEFLALDKGTRFAGAVDRIGKIVAAAYTVRA